MTGSNDTIAHMSTAENASAPLLALEGVSKRFGSTQALSKVSMQFSAGEVHALVGENGAGKSTLVKIVSGVHQPDSGIVRMRGREVYFDGPNQASLAGIHLVHQELALLPHRTVVENVFLGSEERGLFGLAWQRMSRVAEEALDRLGLSLDVHRPVGELSTANQQMVEIARAIFRESKLIILDEPTAALPPADAERLFEVLRQLAHEGTGVIYISHRLEEVTELADTVSVLKDGAHVATEPASGMDVDRMIQLMVGRVIEDLFPSREESPEGEPALEIDGLIAPPAVLQASLTVRAGEIVGLYGLEGHGQDELLDVIAGARHPVHGTLRLHGKSVPWASVASMISQGVGLVPEDRKTEGLVLPLSSRENISLPVLRRFSNWSWVLRDKERGIAERAAKSAGVHGDLDAPASSLSGGNQQKLVLSKLLAAESSVLVMNQPTRGVDVGSKAEIYALIRDICRKERRAALVVSREIKELQGMCDRILVMSHGRLVAEHSPQAGEEAILGSAVGRKGA